MSALSQIKKRIRETNNAQSAYDQRCVVIVGTQKREPSLNEPKGYRPADIMSCLHDISYTMPCRKCRRTRSEAEAQRERFELKLMQSKL